MRIEHGELVGGRAPVLPEGSRWELLDGIEFAEELLANTK